MPSTSQLIYAACFFATGLGFLTISFMVFLPIVIVAPAKFAFAFTFGSVLMLTAFATLTGWKSTMEHMLGKDRMWFSVGKQRMPAS